MKKFAKILSLVMVVVLALSMAACGAEKTEEGEVYTVGICQLVQHEALDAATKGFKDALTEKLGDKVKFDEQNASNEANNCTTITNKFVADKVDLIMANATPALTAAYNATEKIPVVATSITDYATALNIPLDEWTGKSGFNVTGTADLAPLDKQAAMVKELVPTAKKVGIIYASGEANSKFQVAEITKEFKALGLDVAAYAFADTNDATGVVTKAASECDVLYAPTDNTVASNGDLINNIIEPKGIPLIAGEAGICKKCGIATLSIEYYDIGYEAGEMAYDILVNGKNPAEMEIVYTPEEKLTKLYDKARCDKLGITVPDGYTEIK